MKVDIVWTVTSILSVYQITFPTSNELSQQHNGVEKAELLELDVLWKDKVAEIYQLWRW